MKILCVEDDAGLAALLRQVLTKQHYQVELATDGLIGWNLAETETYNLILLDWILPKLTGIEFCQKLRTEKHTVLNPNQNTPVLLMTALDAVTHKIMGLDAGADDYIVKPFDLDELLARIRALLRRNQNARSPLLQWGEVCLSPSSCEVTYQGQPVALATKEYELLELFLRHPEQIFSPNRLLTALWKLDEMPGEGAVRAHIKGLRQKIKQAGAEDPIETVYKLGYRLKHWNADTEGDAGDEQGKRNRSNPTHREQTNREQTNREQTHRGGNPDGADTPDRRMAKNPAALSSLTAVSSSVPPELWEAWQEVRQSYRDRLSVIQQTVTALQNQVLSPEQQQAAAREAHTLVGSLGSFGLEAASQISRHIQQILQQTAPLAPSDSEKLLPLIAALARQLDSSDDEQAVIPELSPASPLFLIVENDLSGAKALAAAAQSWGLQVEIATTFKQAENYLQQGTVGALLLNLDCADAKTSGLEFLAIVHLQYPALPVATLTAENSLERRLAAVRLGTRCFLKTPIAPPDVLAAIAPVLPLFPASTARILILDSDLAALQRLHSRLVAAGYDVTGLSQPEQFWSVLEQSAPDLLILAVELDSPAAQPQPNPAGKPLSGIELCQVIRSDPDWQRLPVLLLTGQTDPAAVQHCLTVGADDVLSQPVVFPELLIRMRNRLEHRTRWRLNPDRSPSIPTTASQQATSNE